ncbi:MAG: hypothetical protein ACJ77E_03580 [Gaiellaceae bacterium]
MASATTTTSQDAIRRWVEERGGRPARVADTGRRRRPRASFGSTSASPTKASRRSRGIEWFRAFDGNELAFLHDDDSESRFNKLVSRADSGN